MSIIVVSSRFEDRNAQCVHHARSVFGVQRHSARCRLGSIQELHRNIRRRDQRSVAVHRRKEREQGWYQGSDGSHPPVRVSLGDYFVVPGEVVKDLSDSG